MFTRAVLDVDNGQSGLAIDGGGALWTVEERGGEAYRITLAGDRVERVDRVPIDGVPDETDLEAVAWLAPGRFAFGTETHILGKATVLLASERNGRLVVDGTIELPSSLLGVEVGSNAGAEGVCGSGDVLLTAIETAGVAGGRRYAPLARVDLATGKRTAYRLWLNSNTGKIAALDCSVDPDGTAHVIAIERHFEVTKILELRIPPGGGDLTADRVLDLSPILRGSLNLEGIARRPDGRWVVINDNQSGPVIFGGSQLLLFK